MGRKKNSNGCYYERMVTVPRARITRLDTAVAYSSTLYLDEPFLPISQLSPTSFGFGGFGSPSNYDSPDELTRDANVISFRAPADAKVSELYFEIPWPQISPINSPSTAIFTVTLFKAESAGNSANSVVSGGPFERTLLSASVEVSENLVTGDLIANVNDAVEVSVSKGDLLALVLEVEAETVILTEPLLRIDAGFKLA